MTGAGRGEGGAMRGEAEAEFREFVAGRSPALLRTAYLLTGGDRALAEDLLQAALVKAYLAWPRIENREAYVRRTLATTATSWWRLRRSGERATDELPEAGEPDRTAAVDQRDELWPLVRALPARQRAVVVLRFYEDLSEADTARTLGISTGTVKSHTARALATLRAALSTTGAH